MKSRPHDTKGVDKMASQYEVVKVLGKGSFGVVRLVREKDADESVGSFLSSGALLTTVQGA
jgi:hypothetical protein